MNNSRTFSTGILIVIGAIVLAVLAAGAFSGNPQPARSPSPSVSAASSEKISIKAPQGAIRAEVAETPASRERGLSGRASMPAAEGMLFIFSVPDMYGFWMKDMKFSLDLVWIGADKKIAGISENAKPESYPQLFFPPRPVPYVLELNAGAAKIFGLKAGVAVEF